MTVNREPHATDLVETYMLESMKTYSVYDVNGQLSLFYEALADSKHGDKCRLTTYTYVGTTRVEKSKESLANWDSSWDI